MFPQTKKLVMLAAFAATLGTASLTASTGAVAMPKAPAIEAESTEQVRHVRRRRLVRGRWQAYPHFKFTPKWRQCQKYWKLWVRTGKSYWNYRYRRCMKGGWLKTP